MTTVPVRLRRPVLAELLPGARARDVAIVVGVALLTAICAQIRVPLPFTPVPVTGQTFAVLLGAAALGPLRASLAQLLYVGSGLILPVYTGGESGWAYASGATGGYLAGFVIASVVVGALARRGADRRAWSTAAAFAVGSAAIYGTGLAWLIAGLDMTPAAALAAGVAPFLIGDALKALLAAGVLPAAWRLLRR